MDVWSQLKERAKYTPDLADLRERKEVLLFVYDSFKSEHHNNSYFKKDECKYLGRAKSHSNDMVMYNVSKVFPIIVEQPIVSDYRKGFILGEVYSVPIEYIMYLDKRKQNGVMFNRKKKMFMLMEQVYPTLTEKINRPYAECHVYIGNKNHFKNHKDLGLCNAILSGANNNVRMYTFNP